MVRRQPGDTTLERGQRHALATRNDKGGGIGRRQFLVAVPAGLLAASACSRSQSEDQPRTRPEGVPVSTYGPAFTAEEGTDAGVEIRRADAGLPRMNGRRRPRTAFRDA